MLLILLFFFYNTQIALIVEVFLHFSEQILRLVCSNLNRKFDSFLSSDRTCLPKYDFTTTKISCGYNSYNFYNRLKLNHESPKCSCIPARVVRGLRAYDYVTVLAFKIQNNNAEILSKRIYSIESNGSTFFV